MARGIAEEIRLGFEKVLRSITQTVSGTVSVSSSALPTGAATSANQSTIITHLLTIIGRLWEKGVLSGNSSTTPLNAGATFTGTGVDVSGYASVSIAIKTDQAGTGEAQFSTDNSNWDSSIPLTFEASTSKQYRFSPLRKYFRVVINNTSASNQTYMRLQSMGGDQQITTSALNTTIPIDAGTVITRGLDFNLDVIKGKFQNHSSTIKTGRSGTIANGNVTEDLHTGGGVYLGFPSTAQAAEVNVAGADTGTLWYSYMATDTDTDYTFASVSLNGVGTVALNHNIWRCNFAYFDAGAGTSFNAGVITIRSVANPATVIWVQIAAGRSESQCAAYTVPYGSTVYLDMERAGMRGGSTGTLDGSWWYREYNKSPRLRWDFGAQAGSVHFDDMDYLQSIPARTDVIPRVTYSSTANQMVWFRFRFIKVKS